MSKDGVDLERIVFIGRTFEEYMAMFSLSTEEMEGKRFWTVRQGRVLLPLSASKRDWT